MLNLYDNYALIVIIIVKRACETISLIIRVNFTKYKYLDFHFNLISSTF